MTAPSAPRVAPVVGRAAPAEGKPFSSAGAVLGPVRVRPAPSGPRFRARLAGCLGAAFVVGLLLPCDRAGRRPFGGTTSSSLDPPSVSSPFGPPSLPLSLSASSSSSTLFLRPDPPPPPPLASLAASCRAAHEAASPAARAGCVRRAVGRSALSEAVAAAGATAAGADAWVPSVASAAECTSGDGKFIGGRGPASSHRSVWRLRLTRLPSAKMTRWRLD